MGTVIAVGCTKGGVSKSTIVVNLAAALAANHKVTIVDADEQATCLLWARAGRLPVTVQALPLEDRPQVPQWTRDLVVIRDQADLIILDTAPHLNHALAAALLASDLLLVPVGASLADLNATSRTLELVRQAQNTRGDSKPSCVLIPARIDRRTASGREIEQALSAMFPDVTVGPVIGLRAAYADALTAGLSVLDYAPRSAAAEEIRNLAVIVKEKLNGKSPKSRH